MNSLDKMRFSLVIPSISRLSSLALLIAGIAIFAMAASKKPTELTEPTAIGMSLHQEPMILREDSSYTVILPSLRGNATVWMEDGVINIFYDTPDHLMHVTSADGFLWSSPRVLGASENRSTPRMIPGTHRGLSAFKRDNIWTIHGIIGLPRKFHDIGNVFYRPSSSPGTYEPGSVIKTADGFVLYGIASAHGFMSGLNNIFRSESVDGRNWSAPKIVITGNDRGLPMGHVINPSMSFDAVAGEWTMWYAASDGVSADERLYICRARSSDGITFHSHEVFLTPEELGRPEIRRLSFPSYVSTDDGDYLYFVAQGAVGGVAPQLIRMTIRQNSNTLPD